jgi:hypothetical protein
MYEYFEKNQVFIGMPFDDSMKDIQRVIEESCKKNGLQAKIVSNGINSNAIIDEIKKLIEESEFLIIDLTLENPNVYYELGYADGVGNEGADILLLAKEGTNLKFDIQHRRVHFYKDAYDLQNKLMDILPKFIQEGR